MEAGPRLGSRALEIRRSRGWKLAKNGQIAQRYTYYFDYFI